MKKLNIIIVYNKEGDELLMCKRAKEPYQGMYNFVGGKVEKCEKGISAAYRELFEETGIDRTDIKLKHFMNFEYIESDMLLEVYVGKLNKEKELVEEVNKLFWMSTDENYFDTNKFAGGGNIGHMLNQIKLGGILDE